jgi:hypothetical protein
VFQARFSWLWAMNGVLQYPVYHAQGHVLIHTRMVTEGFLALGEWCRLASLDRQTLFASSTFKEKEIEYNVPLVN